MVDKNFINEFLGVVKVDRPRVEKTTVFVSLFLNFLMSAIFKHFHMFKWMADLFKNKADMFKNLADLFKNLADMFKKMADMFKKRGQFWDVRLLVFRPEYHPKSGRL